MTNVTINGNNIVINGTGMLDGKDIRRIDFEFTTVTINGFTGITQDAAWYLNEADHIELSESIKDINDCRFHKAIVNHPNKFSNKKFFKDLNDIKSSLELEKKCNDHFVYLVYPAEHKLWDGTVAKGYRISMAETVFGDERVTRKNEKDFFIEVETVRKPLNLKETIVHQKPVSIYPLNITRNTKIENFVDFLFKKAEDKVFHTGKYNNELLCNQYTVTPTLAEKQTIKDEINQYMQGFEAELCLDKEKTLEKYGWQIYHSEDLQEICKKHITDFHIRIYEQDSFGPVVAGFYAAGKDYAY